MRTILPYHSFLHSLALPESAEELSRGRMTVDAGRLSEVQIPLQPELGASLTPKTLEGLARYLQNASSAELKELFGSAISAKEKVVEAQHSQEELEPERQLRSGVRAAGNFSALFLIGVFGSVPLFLTTLALIKLNEGRREAQFWPSGSKIDGFLFGALELRGLQNVLGGASVPADGAGSRSSADKERVQAESELTKAIKATQAKLLTIAQTSMEL